MACKYEGKGAHVGRCMGTKEIDPCPGYDKCKEYKPDYKTNADCIRAMSDEELAGFFVGLLIFALNEFGINVTDDIAEAEVENTLKYLEQPAEDEE